MHSRFEAVRSVSDKSLHVIFRAGDFETLPDRIRSLGPWQGLSGGIVDELKPHYRLQLFSRPLHDMGYRLIANQASPRNVQTCPFFIIPTADICPSLFGRPNCSRRIIR